MVRLRAPPADSGGSWPRYRVLLIEDNKWDAELTQQLLSEAGHTGFNMEWSQRLTDGLVRLAQGDVDLVLLDLSLPDSRGLATVAKLRTEAPHMPLIVLTGLEDESTGTEAIKLGAEDYLVKGRYDGQLLLRSMRYAIERHRFQQERRAALEWKKELDHLREVDRLRTLFMNTTPPAVAQAVPGYSGNPLVDDEDRVKTAEERLSELIDQLVGIVHIQEGTATLRRESADLNQMVRELVDSAQALADRQRIGLDAYAQGPLFVELDPLRIIQVIRGLLDNALRFTTPGGRVLVETETKGTQVVVRVRDTGAGMSPEETDQLFRSPKPREPGVLVPRGLSLFLTKQLVELHGGQIWAHSDGPGHGSTISFSLPLRPG